MTASARKKKTNITVLTPVEEKFHCPYCKKDFLRENSLINHMCEKKRRFFNKDEKYVKLGFLAYQKFYAIQYSGRKLPTYEDFSNSKFYTSFTAFGRYILDVNALRPEGFIEFVIKTGVPLKNWTLPVVYETYVRELTKKMTPEMALEQGILLAQQWSQESAEPWNDFFRKIHPNLAVQWIRTGRINPWFLYAAPSSKDLFDRMSDEQMGLVSEYLDPKVWKARMKVHKSDFDWVRKQLVEAGL